MLRSLLDVKYTSAIQEKSWKLTEKLIFTLLLNIKLYYEYSYSQIYKTIKNKIV